MVGNVRIGLRFIASMIGSVVLFVHLVEMILVFRVKTIKENCWNWLNNGDIMKCKNCGEEVVSKYVEFSAFLFFIVGVFCCGIIIYDIIWW